MDVFGIVIAVMLVGFVVWIMLRGGYSWRGGWPGERPNYWGIALFLLLVVVIAVSIASHS
jgi:hypothetical protein